MHCCGLQMKREASADLARVLERRDWARHERLLLGCDALIPRGRLVTYELNMMFRTSVRPLRRTAHGAALTNPQVGGLNVSPEDSNEESPNESLKDSRKETWKESLRVG